MDFLSDTPNTIFRYTFEAIDCKLHDIDGDEAVDAIVLAISRYFEEGDAPHVETAQFSVRRDIDFKLTTAWDNKTESFTLLSNGEIEYPVK